MEKRFASIKTFIITLNTKGHRFKSFRCSTTSNNYLYRLDMVLFYVQNCVSISVSFVCLCVFRVYNVKKGTFV